MDAVIHIEQLEDALANSSDPYFVFEKETNEFVLRRVCVDS